MHKYKGVHFKHFLHNRVLSIHKKLTVCTCWLHTDWFTLHPWYIRGDPQQALSHCLVWDKGLLPARSKGDILIHYISLSTSAISVCHCGITTEAQEQMQGFSNYKSLLPHNKSSHKQVGYDRTAAYSVNKAPNHSEPTQMERVMTTFCTAVI